MTGDRRFRGRHCVLLSTIAVVVAACGKGGATGAQPAPQGAAVSGAVPPRSDDEGGGLPMDAREAAQWARAQRGDAAECMRLADLVGCAGLRDRASRPELRAVAIRAAAYCNDFSGLPWLAQVATVGGDDDARAALESMVDLAARPRRSTDPEDASELHAGCAALLSLARSSAPKARRAKAIDALRMLSERGCVTRSEIPTDLDVH